MSIRDIAFWSVIAIDGQLATIFTHGLSAIIGAVMSVTALIFLGWGRNTAPKVRVEGAVIKTGIKVDSRFPGGII